MEKAKLTRYLDKVRIGNHIEQAQISTKDGVSHTWVASKDKDALVVLKMTKSEIPDSVLEYDDTTEVIIQFAWDSLIKWIGNEYWVGKHFDSMDPVAASSIANHSSVFTTKITDENCVLLEQFS